MRRIDMRFTSDRRRRAAFAASMILAASIAAASAGAQRPALPRTTPGRFRVVAPDLASQGRITLSHVFNGMGCSGQNISPALQWYNPPAGTRSFAVTAYDPDAPTGSGWWHWVMYNIPAGTTGLPAGAGNGRNAPRGSAQGQTDFGTKGYGGPCPPAGDRPHHYHFTVFALKVDKLDISGNATAAYVGFNLNANKLATARVTALYAR
jgi:Raf kinase inhibitor-like YbhB/YbcL family protein